MSDQRAWDKESVYDEQIFPLMSKEQTIGISCSRQIAITSAADATD